MLKSQEIKTNIAEKLKAYKADETADKAAIMDEIKAMEKELDDALAMEAVESKLAEKSFPAEQKEVNEVEKESYTEAFLKAMKNEDFKTLKDFSEGVKADGGYTVPEDIVNKVRQLRTAEASLLNLVNVESVSTETGARTYQTRGQAAGFTEVGEGQAIGKSDTPTFGIVEYAIKKYAGIFAVTNEVLDDSAENLQAILTSWMANNSRVTANKLILAKLKTLSPVALAVDELIDNIKEILNVKLGQAFKPYSTIVTNDDGLQLLDTLKDADGDYLLTNKPDEPMKMVLAAGATTIPVTVIPNADLPTEAGKIPFIIGDLKSAVTYFDRKKSTITVSNTAAAGDLNAFANDLTLFRCVEREDVQLMDEKAAVYATVTRAA